MKGCGAIGMKECGAIGMKGCGAIDSRFLSRFKQILHYEIVRCDGIGIKLLYIKLASDIHNWRIHIF